MRVINAALTLKLEHLESERKKSTKKGAFVSERVCKMFRIAPNTYGKIINQYMSEQDNVYKSAPSGNFNEKPGRLPKTSEVAIKIRVTSAAISE
eukprot:scaffold21657_cov85-Amphora_coffeaeformis.AAC.1